MAPQVIAAIRWFFLSGAIISLLQATVLFNAFQRYLFQPWFRMSDRVGAAVPRIMRDRRFQRGWPLLMTLAFGAIWWVTGTAAGQAWLQRGGR